ncbi:MAG: hypothetical protein IPN36_16975 [Bacteroidetes bacterium]|nr:hypothetical protein [Bacteroidota bacterium]
MERLRTLNVSGAPATPDLSPDRYVCSGATYHYSTATVAELHKHVSYSGYNCKRARNEDIDVVFNTVSSRQPGCFGKSFQSMW